MKLLQQPTAPRKSLATLRAKMPNKGIVVGGILRSKPTETERRESAALVALHQKLIAEGEKSRREAMKKLAKMGYKIKPDPPYRGGFRMS